MTAEGSVLSAIQELLKVRRIRHHRLNSGLLLIKGTSGKGRAVKMGERGTADILALPFGKDGHVRVLYIEAKAGNGKQSESQMEFERDVVQEGHSYIVARSTVEVEAWLRRNECW